MWTWQFVFTKILYYLNDLYNCRESVDCLLSFPIEQLALFLCTCLKLCLVPVQCITNLRTNCIQTVVLSFIFLYSVFHRNPLSHLCIGFRFALLCLYHCPLQPLDPFTATPSHQNTLVARLTPENPSQIWIPLLCCTLLRHHFEPSHLVSMTTLRNHPNLFPHLK